MNTQTITTQTHGQGRRPHNESASARAHLFLSYLCTRYLLKFNRPKGDDQTPGKWVHIPTQSIKGTKRRYIDGDLIPYNGIPGEWSALIDELISEGAIQRETRKTPVNGRKSYYYSPGNIDPLKYFDPEAIQSELEDLSPLHTYMANCMAAFEVENNALEAFIHYLGATNPERQKKYLTAFKWLKTAPRLFYKVDDFAGRVHTPYSSMETFLRPHITYNGDPVTSVDLKTSQPVILGEILAKHIPGNEFTEWTRKGLDVYELMAARANLPNRQAGKDLFFQLIFAPPKKQLEVLYPGAKWVQWLNDQKCKGFTRPHHSNQRHTKKRYNVIAYYLQRTEALIMGEVWQYLKGENIPFLSVHDEIIIPAKYGHIGREIFQHKVKHNKVMKIPHAQISTNKGDDIVPKCIDARSEQIGHLIDPEIIDRINNMECHTIKDRARQWANAERAIYEVTKGNTG